MNSIFKKITVMVMALVVISTSFTYLNAATTDLYVEPLIDFATSQNVYKLSQDKGEINLPYVRISKEMIYMDKEVKKPGMVISSKAIDITGKMTEPQLIFSSDTVRVNADTDYSVILAYNVIISSSINKSMLIFAQNVTIEKDVTISDDVICYANDIKMSGTVKGSFIARTGKLSIDGNIEKDLRIMSKELTIADGSIINGKIHIQTENKSLNIKDKYPQAEIVYVDFSKTIDGTTVFEYILRGFTACLIFVLVYLLINRLSKGKVFENILEKCKLSPIYTLFTGILCIILAPIVLIILLLLSFLGLGIVTGPVLIILTAMYTVTTILSTFIVGSVVFEYIKNKYKEQFTSQLNSIVGLLLVYAVIYTLCRLPYISWYATIAVVFIAMGIIFTSLTKKLTKSTEIVDKK